MCGIAGEGGRDGLEVAGWTTVIRFVIFDGLLVCCGRVGSFCVSKIAWQRSAIYRVRLWLLVIAWSGSGAGLVHRF